MRLKETIEETQVLRGKAMLTFTGSQAFTLYDTRARCASLCPFLRTVEFRFAA